jgi:hypothetical protein
MYVLLVGFLEDLGMTANRMSGSGGDRGSLVCISYMGVSRNKERWWEKIHLRRTSYLIDIVRPELSEFKYVEEEYGFVCRVGGVGWVPPKHWL